MSDACGDGDHEFIVAARQAPWWGCWHIHVECVHCPASYQAPGRFWRRATVQRHVTFILRRLDYEAGHTDQRSNP